MRKVIDGDSVLANNFKPSIAFESLIFDHI